MQDYWTHIYEFEKADHATLIGRAKTRFERENTEEFEASLHRFWTEYVPLTAALFIACGLFIYGIFRALGWMLAGFARTPRMAMVDAA